MTAAIGSIARKRGVNFGIESLTEAAFRLDLPARGPAVAAVAMTTQYTSPAHAPNTASGAVSPSRVDFSTRGTTTVAMMRLEMLLKKLR
jgi:hypothetical protein